MTYAPDIATADRCRTVVDYLAGPRSAWDPALLLAVAVIGEVTVDHLALVLGVTERTVRGRLGELERAEVARQLSASDGRKMSSLPGAEPRFRSIWSLHPEWLRNARNP